MEQQYDLIGLAAAAEYAHVERQAIWFAINRGHLQAEKVNGKWCTSKKMVDEYITNKYNREEKKRDADGNPVFNVSKGTYSVHASAKYLSLHLKRKVSAQRVYYLLYRGYLPGSKAGKAWVIRVEDLEKIISIEEDAVKMIFQK